MSTPVVQLLVRIAADTGGGSGGAAGAAIDGDSFVTLGTWSGVDEEFTDGEVGTEDIQGPQIN